MSNSWLASLAERGEIEFYEGSKKLDVQAKKCDAETEKAWLDCNASEFDKYVWRIERYLEKQVKEYMVIKSAVRKDTEEVSSLEGFLTQENSVFALADFCVGVHVSPKYSVKVWVDADIDKIGQYYAGKREGELVNGLGTARIDTTKWGGRMSVFERDWNLALCGAWGGFVGYPGYEWPRTAKQFEECCAEHASSIMIGTREQLCRYERLAKKYVGCAGEIRKVLDLFK